MDGTITLASAPGKGSTFRFTVRLQLVEEPYLAAEPLPAPVTAPARLSWEVLLAEDNEVNQIIACAMLEAMGCRVEVADNGRKALEHLERREFDVLLLDCQMPVLDGFETISEIRKNEATQRRPKRLPVIALTANAMAGDREHCLLAGFDDYLSKPFTTAQLYEVLQRCRLATATGTFGFVLAPAKYSLPTPSSAAGTLKVTRCLCGFHCLPPTPIGCFFLPRGLRGGVG